MSIFSSPLHLEQEVEVRGKRGKITGVMATSGGINIYRVAFPVSPGPDREHIVIWANEQMFSAADVIPAPREIPAPNGMEHFLCRLDSCLGNSYYADQEDFFKAADAMLREKRPYHGYEWNATKGRYVMVQIANHPYPEP